MSWRGVHSCRLRKKDSDLDPGHTPGQAGNPGLYPEQRAKPRIIPRTIPRTGAKTQDNTQDGTQDRGKTNWINPGQGVHGVLKRGKGGPASIK